MARIRSPVMVGRGSELQRLGQTAFAVRSGRSGSVLILGEAGIGKTRLVTEFVAGLAGPDTLVLCGHGVDLAEGALPYGVLSESLRDLVRQVGVPAVRRVLGAQADALAPLVPRLGPSAAPLDRGRIFSATIDLLDGLATDRLVCWVVEDLQWVDPPSGELFSYAVRTLASSGILTIATERTGPNVGLDELERASSLDTIVLRPLSAEETREQVVSLGLDLSVTDVERTVELGAGVPFFVEELAASWDRATGLDPSLLQRLTLNRLKPLKPEVRDLINAAALGADHLFAPLLGHLGWGQSQLQDAVAAGMLESDPSRGTVRFCHPLIREAVEQSLLPVESQRWHRAWAEALEAQAPRLTGVALTSALARHWYAADEPERAIRFAAQAARDAGRLGSPDEEYLQWSRVLELWRRVADPAGLSGTSHAAAMTDMVATGFATGDRGLVVRGCEAELERLDPSIDPLGEVWLRWRLSMMRRHRDGRVGSVDQMALQQLLTYPASDPRVINGLAMMSNQVWRPSPDDAQLWDARQRFVEALATVETPQDVVWVCIAISSLGVKRGVFDQAVDVLLEQQPRVRDGTIRDRWMFGVHLAWNLLLLGRTGEAVKAIQTELAALTRPEAVFVPYLELMENLAFALVALGEWDQATDVVQSALDAAPPVPMRDAPGRHSINTDLGCHLTSILLARGELDAAQPWVDDIAETVGGHPWESPYPDGMFIAQLITASAAHGDLRGCRSLMRPALELERPDLQCEFLPFALSAALRAETTLAAIDESSIDSETSDYAKRLLAIGSGLNRPGPRGAAWWAEATAHAQRAQGRDNAEHWSAAATRWRDCGHKYDVALCLLRQGETALRHGDSQQAESALSECSTIAKSLGCRPLANQVSGLARRGHLNLATPLDRATAPGPLTPRETDVLELLARGSSNKQIASALFMSPKTASVHVSHILTKLGASNRTQAVALARNLGLTT